MQGTGGCSVFGGWCKVGSSLSCLSLMDILGLSLEQPPPVIGSGLLTTGIRWAQAETSSAGAVRHPAALMSPRTPVDIHFHRPTA